MLNGRSVHGLITQYKHLDKSVLDSAKAFALGEINVHEFDNAIKKTSSATSKLANSLKSVGANIGIMLAINLAIKAATAIWDEFNETVEEAESKLNETKSVISDLESQIAELESIDANALTQGQKDKLQNLKDQLEVQKQLEEVEKRRLAREKLGTGNWSDQFDKSSYAHAKKDMDKAKAKSASDSMVIGQLDEIDENIGYWQTQINIAEIEKQSQEYIDTLKNELSKANDVRTQYVNEANALYSDLISQKADILSWSSWLEEGIKEGLFVGKDLDYANAELERLSGELTWVEELMKRITLSIYDGDDSLEAVISDKTMYSVEQLLKNGFTEDELTVLATLDFDKNASLGKLREVLDASKETVEDFGNEMSIPSLEELHSNLDAIQDAYDTVASAIEEYNKQGYLSVDTYQSLMELEPQYLQYLMDEEGNLRLGTDAMNDYTSALIDNMAMKKMESIADYINTLSAEERQLYLTKDATDEASASLVDFAASVLQDKIALNELSEDELEGLKSMMASVASWAESAKAGLEKGGLGGGGSASKQFSETIDFFEERVENLNDAISLLDKNLENVVGSFAKNKLVDAEIDLNAKKMNDYSNALAMYSQKASEALSSIPADLRDKVVNGAIAINEFVGEGNEAVVDAIKEYQKWSDKISDCQQELAELKEAIRDLELEKYNNLMEDFQSQFDIRENSKSLIDKQIDLFREAGELIGESFYQESIEQSQKQLQILEQEKVALTEHLTSALASGNIERGTDEWLEMVNSLTELDGQIIDCKKSIEEFDNAILDLHTEIFERIQNEFSNLNSELENLGGLFEDFDVANSDGAWSKEGLSRLGLLSQQYELARYQVEQYNIEIKKLNEDYANGKYSAIEYSDRLAELSQKQWECVNSSEEILSSIVELNKIRVDEEIEGINKQIEAYEKLVNAQIKSLDSEKD